MAVVEMAGGSASGSAGESARGLVAGSAAGTAATGRASVPLTATKRVSVGMAGAWTATAGVVAACRGGDSGA
jgi:hypothetical protein